MRPPSIPQDAEIVTGAVSEATAHYSVASYGWLTTSERVWLEDGPDGVRMARQSFNPHGERWNRTARSQPKPVAVLYAREGDKTRWAWLDEESTPEEIAEFCGEVGFDVLTPGAEAGLRRLIETRAARAAA